MDDRHLILVNRTVDDEVVRSLDRLCHGDRGALSIHLVVAAVAPSAAELRFAEEYAGIRSPEHPAEMFAGWRLRLATARLEGLGYPVTGEVIEADVADHLTPVPAASAA